MYDMKTKLTNRLTKKQKREYRPIMIKYYGRVCFYCKSEFIDEIHKVNGYNNPYMENYEHLNCKEHDNRIENIVLCHVKCNQDKKDNTDFQILAKEQLEQNENDGVLTGMWEGEKKKRTAENEQKEKNKEQDYNDEIYSNIEGHKITLEYLNEKLSVDDKIPLKSTIDSITAKCRKIIGHASQNSVRRYIDELASDEGIFMIFRVGGKRWIAKRDTFAKK